MSSHLDVEFTVTMHNLLFSNLNRVGNKLIETSIWLSSTKRVRFVKGQSIRPFSNKKYNLH